MAQVHFPIDLLGFHWVDIIISKVIIKIIRGSEEEHLNIVTIILTTFDLIFEFIFN